jgi:lipid-A-disaccharide synthase
VRLLISAGEASGDLYAAELVSRLREYEAGAEFYGCAGPRLRRLGVEPIVDAADLSVVGLAEVVGHLPRIYREYRKLVRCARVRSPEAAILVDNPDFHLRLARHLKQLGIPIFYLVAPQVWAWRQRRVRLIRERIDDLFCLFPFEEGWFRERGIRATYIGHPLARMAQTSCSRPEFLARYHLEPSQPVIVLLPGSRVGEARRHLPYLLDAVERLRLRLSLSAVLAVPEGFPVRTAFAKFRERILSLSIQIVENDTWNAIGHADLALAASGTVTVEAAVMGTPMVTFYRVTPLTWRLGRRLVKVPFFSMVNLVAGERIVPELIQDDLTALNLARAAEELLAAPERIAQMRLNLARVRKMLTLEGDPLRRAAEQIVSQLTEKRGFTHANC